MAITDVIIFLKQTQSKCICYVQIIMSGPLRSLKLYQVFESLY